MFGIIVAGKRVYDKFAEDEMTVYAAQVSFFIILSVVPFIMLLLTAVQMIPSISNARSPLTLMSPMYIAGRFLTASRATPGSWN